MADSGGEKTEKPTPKKRKESRKEGQVPRTQELGQWASMLVVGMLLPLLVRREIEAVRDLMTTALSFGPDTSVSDAMELLGTASRHAFVALVLLGCGVMLIGVSCALAQGGFYLATKQVKPSFGKLNPIKGAKRVFGPQALWEGAKMLLKSALVGLLVWAAIKAMMPLVGGFVPMSAVLRAGTDGALAMVRNVALAALVLAGADYLVMRRRVGKQTRMTKDEVKREHKQTEGDPLVKSAIRGRQLAAARNRMMADVPEADVVLVNPTHIAVALRYDAEKGAPRVVALGAGAVATRIRELAAEHRVPLVRDVPLARSLHGSCKVGQTIPPELFAAVASVLAFVISRRSQGQHGGEHRSPRREEELPAVLPAGRRRRISSAPEPAGR